MKTECANPPSRRYFKEPISGLTHLATAIAACVGSVWILNATPQFSLKWFGILIYCLSLIGLFTASSTYHLIAANRIWSRRLRKLDHAAIYFFIAGTYTPICLYALSGNVRTIMLVLVWANASLGILLKLYFSRSHKWLSVGSYLASGWLAVFVIGDLYKSLPGHGMTWLILGGLFYSVGSVIYATKKFDFFPNVFGHHEIWHLFVMAGGISHFILVSSLVV